MKAALYETTGRPGRAEGHRVERPEPGPGEVRARVMVSGINPTDVKARSGAIPRPIDGFQIPGQDGAGVIDAVGAGVDPARAGQRVWLFLAAAGRKWGTAAEWTVLPERHAVPLPDGADVEMGATWASRRSPRTAACSRTARWPARPCWWRAARGPLVISPPTLPNGPVLESSPR